MRGNSCRSAVGLSRYSDHPRACGELLVALASTHARAGSSPRMRGTLHPSVCPASDTRIIPAHAGNSCRGVVSDAYRSDHPRACGELVNLRVDGKSKVGSSPRMRGTRSCTASGRQPCRIIPAHAGNSPADCQELLRLPDHPRACGELVDTGSAWLTESGSSPRMRGTR